MAATSSISTRFASALSTEGDTARAIAETADRLCESLGGAPDLAFAFVSHHHVEQEGGLAQSLSRRLETNRLLGCTGESIVGGAREIEGRPAVALWGAKLPGVSIDPMRLEAARTPDGISFVGWPDGLSEPWPDGAALIVLGEPFTFPADALLARLNEDRPGVPVVGGMASGASGPGENRLILGPDEFDSGAVAALIHGPISVQTVVSQGCRPIGRPFVVTKAERNVILELGGKPPLVQLKDLFGDLTDRERELVTRGLHVGQVTNEYRETFDRGDFLVRNVVAADPKTGAIAIGDLVRAGQTVQFHVRDEETADEDLNELLSKSAAGGAAQAGLLFTCNGRGTRLFGRPDHDAATIHQQLGDIPLAGFFAQGEIGPIGGKNYLHGFTASVVLFGGREPT